MVEPLRTTSTADAVCRTLLGPGSVPPHGSPRTRPATRPADTAILVTADPEVAVRLRCDIAGTAADSVLLLDRTPATSAEPTGDLLRRGLWVRAVQEPTAPGRSDRLAAAGADVRTLPALPMTYAVYDRRAAVIDLDGAGTAFVRSPALVAGLVTLFDLVWDRAQPLAGAHSEPTGAGEAEDAAVVALLAAGLKDESIARQLGISASTVTRRVARLMEATGASTRFQLGLQAARRRWV
ncbi:MAG: hypothetical protein QOE45_1681 [Frankiaceae bacterium]|jgi:DNA-binding CsgD family transcriptional regulator|nr:hypothetical protein [Frankiaceae bacterium]